MNNEIELIKQVEDLKKELTRLNGFLLSLLSKETPMGKMSRRVVRDKSVYEFEINIPIGDNLDEHLANQKKAFEYYEKLSTIKQVEDKLIDAKKRELE